MRLNGASVLCVLTILLLSCSDEEVLPPPPDNLDTAEAYNLAIAEPLACQPCHPNHYAEWEASMHHYAIHDPVFIRLNEIGQERSGNQLGQFCIVCHSPVATKLNETEPGFDPAALSPKSMAGVSCEVCHKMSHAPAGKGVLALRLDNVQQGPIADPISNSFHRSEYQSRYKRSAICQPCHDVRSPENVLIEKTSTEWDNSAYAAMGLECQGCHMPTYEGQAAVGGPTRSRVHRHSFVGVDVPLTDFPGREQTIEQVRELLQNSVDMRVALPEEARMGETFSLMVSIANDRTGHNVPSGTIFERQMWLEVLVRSQGAAEPFFASGLLDENKDLRNDSSVAVKNGTLARDADLRLFNGIARRDGKSTLFFWEADEVIDHTIPPFESRLAEYRVVPPQDAGATIDVSVRLLFRAFPPYMLRAIGHPELVDELPIFEMERFSVSLPLLP